MYTYAYVPSDGFNLLVSELSDDSVSIPYKEKVRMYVATYVCMDSWLNLS